MTAGGSSPVTVAHVITHLGVGGAQETVVRICAGLDRGRFRLLILAGPTPAGTPDLSDGSRVASLKGVTVVPVASLVRPIHPLRDFRAIAEVRAVLLRENAQIVHTHSSKAGLVGRLGALAASAPILVHTVHGWAIKSQTAWPVWKSFQALERSLAHRTDALVVVAGADRELGLAFGIGRRDQYNLIRSGIPIEEYATRGSGLEHRAAARRTLGLPSEVPVVGSVTRLAPPKDTDTLLRSFALVREIVPGVRFVVVGDGPDGAEARAQAVRLDLGGSIHWTGARSDVATLLPAFDVSVLASHDEGLPRTIIEAMAAGVPVVASDVGSVHEAVVDGRTGRLVRPRDPAAMGQAIIDLLDDPGAAAQLVVNARISIDEFDEAAMVTATEALYDSLISARVDRVSVP